MTLKYFAYGSNLHPLRLLERVPSSLTLGVAELKHHSLRFHKRGGDGSGKCNVVHTGAATDSVIGVVYQMAAAERHLLDRAEGLGNGYELAENTVSSDDISEHEVFYYQAPVAHTDESLLPFTWYKQLVVEGARIHALPAHYVNLLETIRAHNDPDAARSALHLDILTRWNPATV